jgi:hypothetical protein
MLLSDEGINTQSIALLRMSADKWTALGGMEDHEHSFCSGEQTDAKASG